MGNIIRTDFTLFDELVHRVDSDPEYFYTPWGGKCEFLQALASRVISEYKYFESNPEEATSMNSRFADLIDAQIYYEALKTAVIGEPVKVVDPEDFFEGCVTVD